MGVLSTILQVAIVTQVVFASTLGSRAEYAVKETYPAHSKWSSAGRAPLSHMLHLQIGLKQNGFDDLEMHLLEVSDPNNSRYGQHLSIEEVHHLIKPSDKTLDLVHEWLSLNGVNLLNHSPAKDWINIYIDVESAERLLDTEYSVFKHEDGSHLIRTTKWSLPGHLHDLIDTIQPTTSFMRPKGQKTDFIGFKNNYVPPGYKPPSNGALDRVCDVSTVTLACFSTLYGTKGYHQRAPGINKIAFNNYLNQTPVRPDIYQFLHKYNRPAALEAYTFKSIEIASGPPALRRPLIITESNGEDHYQEANLDSQTILGMASPMPVYSYSTGGAPPFMPDAKTPGNTNEPYLTWVQYLSAQKDIPQVISSSYGDDEQSVPRSYAIRVCQQFAQLGARGITLLVSSGDDGLGGPDSQVCVSNDGKKKPMFLPAFPSGCPYVTTVGATMEFQPEIPAYVTPTNGLGGNEGFFYASGSGFSNYFSRPKYQDGVVDKYVKSLPRGLYKGLYNSSYPDLAAQGLNFAFFFNLTESVISGTSASSPLMSSILSLVNDALISSGRPPLGFLNPWLYSRGYEGFTDVIGGQAASCGTSGFPVLKGWDPSTGFGTPIFPRLLALVGVGTG